MILLILDRSQRTVDSGHSRPLEDASKKVARYYAALIMDVESCSRQCSMLPSSDSFQVRNGLHLMHQKFLISRVLILFNARLSASCPNERAAWTFVSPNQQVGHSGVRQERWSTEWRSSMRRSVPVNQPANDGQRARVQKSRLSKSILTEKGI